MDPVRAGPRVVDRLRPYLLVAVAVAVLQVYFGVLPYLGILGDWVAYFVVPLSLLGLLWLWIRAERGNPSNFGWVIYDRPWRTLGLVALATGAYLAVVLEAGAFVGLTPLALPTPLTSALLILAAPLLALSQVGIFQGYFLRRLADRGGFLRAVGTASLAFAISSTNFPLLFRLSVPQAGQYIFLDSGTAFALSVVLGVFVYKSRWSLFGPAALESVLLLIPALFPLALATTDWEFSFLVEVFAYSAILVLVVTLVREPSYLAHRYLGEEFGPQRYRFLRRTRDRSSARRMVLAALVVVGLSCAGAVALQAWSGTHTPLLAIATGSMTPTLVRGDLVVIQHVSSAQIAVGDIIAYSGSCLPAPTVHRVISITSGPSGPVYTTKGDANPSPDPCPVPYSEVDGRVVAVIPAAGYLLLEPAFTVGAVAVAILIPPVLRRNEPRPRGMPQW